MDDVKKLMALFDGLRRAYGTYRITGTKNKKNVGEAVTKNGDVTEALWKDHVDGKQGIGIIPIRDDATCSFGAIDVDKYDGLDYKKVVGNVAKKKYPIVACTSKSGGLHLFVFSKKPVPASVMRTQLTTMAASLGFGGCEIFPKQDKILVERGDLGSWINMPYFDCANTKRHAVDSKGAPVNLAGFLKMAEAARVDMNAYKVPDVSSGDFVDGPPCLQYLIEKGEATEGMRNVTMFNVAVYLKKAVPDQWEQRLTEVNDKLKPPLTKIEVTTIYKSVKKREYFYACTKPPLSSFCDRGTCRLRKYGIGAEGDFPLLTGLTKYDTAPPIWFVDVDGGGRLELMTEDLQNQIRFQRYCMDRLNMMPPIIKPEQWRSLIQSLMEKMTVIDVPCDASSVGQFFGHLENFCTARAQARTKEEILIGKPWLDEKKHFFRMSDFMDYLERKKFREFKVHKVAQLLREKGGEHHFIRLHSKGINVWSVPEFEKRAEEELPAVDGTPRDPM